MARCVKRDRYACRPQENKPKMFSDTFKNNNNNNHYHGN